MTLADIQTANINPATAREAFLQSSARLGDILDTKKSYEQKAFTLFGGYLTVTLALVGVAGAIFDRHGLTPAVWTFAATGGVFALGATCLVVALLDATYGAVASDPKMWLQDGVIDGSDSELGRMLAYITFHHQRRIDESIKSNDAKASWIRRGVFLGIGAPLLFAVVLAALALC